MIEKYKLSFACTCIYVVNTEVQENTSEKYSKPAPKSNLLCQPVFWSTQECRVLGVYHSSVQQPCQEVPPN